MMKNNRVQTNTRGLSGQAPESNRPTRWTGSTPKCENQRERTNENLIKDCCVVLCVSFFTDATADRAPSPLTLDRPTDEGEGMGGWMVMGDEIERSVGAEEEALLAALALGGLLVGEGAAQQVADLLLHVC